jgi:hypothetical protein
MTTVNKYAVYCETETDWQHVWSIDPPTVCPNNNGHTITLDSVHIVDSVAESKVSINEEDTPSGVEPTGGNYRLFSQTFDCPPNATTTSTFSFAYPVSIVAGFLNTSLTQRGDVLSIECAPDTTVGALTANVTASDTVINVSPTVTANMLRGRHARFIDGGTITPYYLVVSVDSAAGTITLANPIAESLSALTPTYVQMTVKYAEDVEIGEPGMYTIGTNKIGASYVPANTPFRITYLNNSADDKRPSMCIELLY